MRVDSIYRNKSGADMSQNPHTPNPKFLDRIKTLKSKQQDDANTQIARAKKFDQRHKRVLDEIEGWLRPYELTTGMGLSVFSHPVNLPKSEPQLPGPITSRKIDVDAQGLPAKLVIEGTDFMHIKLGKFGKIVLADGPDGTTPTSFDVVWDDRTSSRWDHDAFEKLLGKYLEV